MPKEDEDDRGEGQFDGSDAGAYEAWKGKSQVWLFGLPNTIGDAKHGAKILTLLKGKAEEDIVDAVMDAPKIKEELTEAGGAHVVHKVVGDPDLPQKFHMLGEVVESYYEMSPLAKNESFRALHQREGGLCRKMGAITDPPSPGGRGWWVVRSKLLKLSNSQIAGVMGQTQGEYK